MGRGGWGLSLPPTSGAGQDRRTWCSRALRGSEAPGHLSQKWGPQGPVCAEQGWLCAAEVCPGGEYVARAAAGFLVNGRCLCSVLCPRALRSGWTRGS